MSVDPVSLGITIALTALNQGMTASRKIEGQRLDDLSVTVADYGVPCNYFVGTRRFDGVPIIWAEKLREIPVKRKTKSGKLTNYEYQATFAFEVADHPCDAVTRIWFDKQLVYDITGAGPPSLFSIKKGFVLADHLRIYLGAEDQMPDPRMQATVDAEHGVGSTPAYRGKTTGVFEEIPVDKFGNRIPQLMVEAARSITAAYPSVTLTPKPPGMSRLWGFGFSATRDRFISADSNSFAIWDLPSRSLISEGSFSPATRSLCSCIAISTAGTIYAPNAASNSILAFPADGLGVGSVLFDTSSAQGCKIEVDSSGREYLCVIAYGSEKFIVYDIAAGALTEYDSGELFGYDFRAADFFFDEYDDLWVVGPEISGTHYVHLHRIIDSGNRPGSPSSLRYASGGSNYLNPVMGLHRSGKFVLFRVDSDEAFIIDQDDFGIVTEKSIALDVYTAYNQVAQLYSGASTLWLDGSEYELPDLTLIRTVNLNSWSGGDVAGIIYDPVNHAFITAPQFASNFTWRYVDRVTGDEVTLQSTVELVHELAGLDPADADASLLTQAMRGYNWTQGSGQDILEPLMDLFDVDPRPHGFLLHYRPRGGVASATLASDNFAQVDADTAPYVFSATGSTDLPRSISLTFADADADQEPNSARASRPLDAADGLEREQTIDMNTLVLTAGEAKALIDRLHRRSLFDAKPYQLSLTAQHIALEPADVQTLTLPSGSVTARLKSLAFDADRTITTEWVRDDPSVAILGNPDGAAMAGHVDQEIRIPGPSRVAILDVPLAADVHDGSVPFLYFGAGPFGPVYWPGADIAISDTGLEVDFESGWAAVSSASAMTWGVVLELPNLTALPWIVDNGSVVNVKVNNGSLSSVTETQLLENGSLNLALIGGEYVQFTTATLQGDGSYNLTGLLRGCRGTEYQISNHVVGEMFVLMNSDIGRREVGAGEIGDFDTWRAVTNGRDITGTFESSLTFAANAHRPYAPVHGVALLDTGTGDWSISATRRTRIGGANVNGQDVPLGEVSESWAADIMDGATVVRTITATSLPLAYTSAQQTTDWGAPQTSIEVNLYQVSPALSLRGFPLNIAA